MKKNSTYFYKFKKQKNLQDILVSSVINPCGSNTNFSHIAAKAGCHPSQIFDPYFSRKFNRHFYPFLKRAIQSSTSIDSI